MKLDWPHVGLLFAVLLCVLVLGWFAYSSHDPNAWAVVGTALTGVLALAGAAFRGQSMAAKANIASAAAQAANDTAPAQAAPPPAPPERPE
jgi:hypothetical protein